MLKRQAAKRAGLLQNTQPPAARTTTLQNRRQAVAQRIGTRFKMKQRLFAFGDDFYIQNERKEKVIKVDGKMLRLKHKLVFEDMKGREIYHIAAKMVDIRETMTIKRPNGDKAAVVKNAWISPIKDKWTINIPGGEDLMAKGNILQHEYEIKPKGSRMPLAIVSKKWFRIRDTYGVELEDAFDAPLILAITVAIDMMSHNNSMNKTMGGISKGSALDIL
jgi:uncharacterized protein YxjI